MTPDSFATGLMANRRVLLVSLTALAMTSLYYALLLTHSDVSGLRVFERVQRVLPQKLLHDTSSRPIDASYSQNSAISDNRSETLVVASRIFVVSLPSRTDRREQMEYLRTALGLRWNYVDAIGSQSDEVKLIMKQTRRKRKATNKPAFRWPRDIDAISSTTRPIPRAGSELWTVVSALNPANMQGNTVLGNAHTIPTASDPPLACATEDDTTPRFTPGLPEFKILTPAKVAVWDSHISAIRRVVEESSWTSVFSAEDVSIILEDDVDMEWDIRTRLGSVWSSLPAGWDAVFLGHCWSNESHYPALYPQGSSTTNTALPPQNTTHLHPSFRPKCTHAYALSRSGARRLLLHLRHPPFAYSRALDQAFAWLVQSGRIRAYSLVPSVVVQRKVGGSDVMNGTGSGWREGLVRGVFGT